MLASDVIKLLEEERGSANLAGMTGHGVRRQNAIGVNLPAQRRIAREIGTDHQLALELWDSKIHEARIIATMIADPRLTDGKLMDAWVSDFYSWDICDQCCMNLFRKTEAATAKALEWSAREPEFEKRAGFALMATLSVHLRKTPDEFFNRFLDAMERESCDPRNFVKKAVNWALRQIGKRNLSLNKIALARAERILQKNNQTASWIARDAIRELKSEKILRIIERRAKK